jgi:hypothetical protein
MFFAGCQNDLSDLETATYSTDPDVFIDAFSTGLNYSAFGGSYTSGFQTDTEVTYNNSSASMRFDVPNSDNAAGSYVGGAFYTTVGRDLSGYDCLTFYAKASTGTSIGTIGFGNDYDTSTYLTYVSDLSISTTWQKYYIPIPDASKLKIEKGLLYLSASPDSDGNGYSFWLDEVKFEKLGTIAHASSSILSGVDSTETSFVGVSQTIDGLSASFSIPTGETEEVSLTSAYFDFSSSNTAVATVDSDGVVTTVGAGTAVITASLAGTTSTGSLTITCTGTFTAAPTPTYDASDVISIFSDAYTNQDVDYYNGYWAPYQTTLSSDFTVSGNNVLNYTSFNYVGIQFSAPTVDASTMSHIHFDLYFPGTVSSSSTFTIQVVDFGADDTYGGTDDSSSSLTYTTSTSTALVSNSWVSIDIPISSLTSLTNTSNIAQFVLSGSNITSFYADNIYFYNDGSVIASVPTSAAPTPTTSSSSVLSIYSDAYTDVSGTNFNTYWGQSTVYSEVTIDGNNTLKYAGLDYQGIELGSSQDVSSKTYLHLDYYTSDSTSFAVYLISTGPLEKSYALTVPSSGGWTSVDIPLTSFSSVVDLSDIIQLKFVGNGDVYVDNIYFH